MSPYSLELTIDGSDKASMAFKAIKRFNCSLDMGSALHLMREHKPLDIPLDGTDRAETLGRLVDLLDELEQFGISYEISANNVPRSSHLWEPSKWTRSEVVLAFSSAERDVKERRHAEEFMMNYVPPEPSPARQLLDQRWRDVSFSDLLKSEQSFIHIWALQAEVNNGGFAIYFDNSSGDTALQTQTALEEIGSVEVHSVLSDAIQLLGSAGGYTSNRQSRWKITSQLAKDAFADLNSRFFETSEDVVGMAFRNVETDYKSMGML